MLVIRQVIFVEDCTGWTGFYTIVAIDTFVGVNDKKIGSFVETLNRADRDAICVFALNAVVCDDICHDLDPQLADSELKEHCRPKCYSAATAVMAGMSYIE